MGLTEDDHLELLRSLMPAGPAWSDAFTGVLLEGFAQEYGRLDERIRQLLDEADPREATELLDEWERLLGLPDECTADLKLSLQDRRRLAWQKLTARGGQSRAYFLALAEQLGEPNSWIDEFRPANCNGNCNGTLYSPADAFTWRINFRRAAVGNRPGNCNDTCEDAVYLTESSLAECPIQERKPAHTTVLFAYALTVYGPSALQAFHTRASKAWAFNEAGVLTEYANDVLRVVPSPAGVLSALREPSSTNKCTNFNANPNGALTGLAKGGDAAATLTEVDDSAALAAAGLQQVCASGKVFKLDNTAGVGAASVSISGVTGNTNTHTVTAYWRGAGAGQMPRLSGSPIGSTPIPAAYTRTSITQVPTTNAANIFLLVEAGGVVYFILNQLEEQLFATTPIPTAGAAATRSADLIQGPLTYRAGGAGVAMKFQLAGPLTANATLVSLDDGTVGNRHAIFASQGSNRFSVYRNVATVETVPRLQLLLRDAAPHGVAYRYKEGDSAAYMDGGGAELTPTSDGAPLPNLTTWRIGQHPGGEHCALYIQEFRLYRWAPTDDELKAATL